jgi:hypothetical protein
MSDICHRLHQLAAKLPLHSFPFVESAIPKNGIYILFEEGEPAHDSHRIVRVGTHTGDNQLRARLRQHFINENKDRSIFRKNIGRAVLNRANDPFLKDWDLDLTTAAMRALHGSRIDREKQRSIEAAVTTYIQSRFRFVVIPVATKGQRLLWESRTVSTIAACPVCKPSPGWLGCSCSIPKIRINGLWQVNELFNDPFTESEFAEFERSVSL